MNQWPTHKWMTATFDPCYVNWTAWTYKNKLFKWFCQFQTCAVCVSHTLELRKRKIENLLLTLLQSYHLPKLKKVTSKIIFYLSYQRRLHCDFCAFILHFYYGLLLLFIVHSDSKVHRVFIRRTDGRADGQTTGHIIYTFHG